MGRWKPTPQAELMIAHRLAGDAWTPCRYDELQPGDIVRVETPEGERVNPVTLEPDDACVAIVKAHPFKNDLGQTGNPPGQGYGVEMRVYASIDDLNQKGLS